nr:MAG: replication associated protein [Circoviridae sp.]
MAYVKKDGEFIDIGECPYKEKMTTAEKNKLYLENNLEDLIEQGELSLFHYKQILVARNMYYMSKRANKERRPVRVIWLWGPTGSGKTRYAIEHAGDEYWISNHSEWFDGYWGQKTVILDDLRASTYKFAFLLRLLDRYPMMVQIKGGWEVWNPEVIYITAPERPEKVFINRETGETWDSIDQLVRRVHEFIEFPREATQPTQDWQEIPEGNDGMDEYYTMKTNWISQ